MDNESIKQRLLAQCKVLESGCWEWTGYRTHLGYGEIAIDGKNWRVHRLSYTAYNGPIPKGMHVCHTCDYRPCFNPAHLWLGTHLDNQRDALAKGRNAQARKTHCSNGHEFAVHGRLDTDGSRACRLCELAKFRMRTGWPRDLAYSLPPGPVGYRPPEAGPIVHVRRQPLVKDHCRRGHEFTPESTYVNPDGRRRCKICQLAAQQRRVYLPERFGNTPAGCQEQK